MIAPEAIFQKPQTEWTKREKEKVYRWFFTNVEFADEWQLRYGIKEYGAYLNPQWFVLLLSQYPSDSNWNILERTFTNGDKRFKKVLRRLIKLPEVSLLVLLLVMRRLVYSRNRTMKKMRRMALERAYTLCDETMIIS